MKQNEFRAKCMQYYHEGSVEYIAIGMSWGHVLIFILKYTAAFNIQQAIRLSTEPSVNKCSITCLEMNSEYLIALN